MEEEKEIKSQIVINDEKFTALRLKMGIANKKYKNTVEGKTRTKLIQQKWVLSKKNDEEYRIRVNKSQRERYRKRVDDAKKKLEKGEDVSLLLENIT